MAKISDYTRKINSFGKSLDKMLSADFPGDPDIADQVEAALATLQYKIIGAFLRKGDTE